MLQQVRVSLQLVHGWFLPGVTRDARCFRHDAAILRKAAISLAKELLSPIALPMLTALHKAPSLSAIGSA